MTVSLSTGSAAADLWLGTLVVVLFGLGLVGWEVIRWATNRRGER